MEKRSWLRNKRECSLKQWLQVLRANPSDEHNDISSDCTKIIKRIQARSRLGDVHDISLFRLIFPRQVVHVWTISNSNSVTTENEKVASRTAQRCPAGQPVRYIPRDFHWQRINLRLVNRIRGIRKKPAVPVSVSVTRRKIWKKKDAKYLCSDCFQLAKSKFLNLYWTPGWRQGGSGRLRQKGTTIVGRWEWIQWLPWTLHTVSL